MARKFCPAWAVTAVPTHVVGASKVTQVAGRSSTEAASTACLHDGILRLRVVHGGHVRLWAKGSAHTSPQACCRRTCCLLVLALLLLLSAAACVCLVCVVLRQGFGAVWHQALRGRVYWPSGHDPGLWTEEPFSTVLVEEKTHGWVGWFCCLASAAMASAAKKEEEGQGGCRIDNCYSLCVVDS